jgi:hypothetical protein
MATVSYPEPRGSMPVLQFCAPKQLRIDPTYQRELDDNSRALIGRIARGWNWDLFQPLVVARRHDGTMYVVDGQHRLEAARLRGDIAQLPSVIFYPADPADEAAVFVELNQQRRPLTAFALYNAALAAGDERALALDAILRQARLGFTGAADPRKAKPGRLNNVLSVRKWHRRNGDDATRRVLVAIGRVYGDQTITIATLLFAGIGAVVLDQGEALNAHLLADVLDRTQEEWLADIRRRAADVGIGAQAAAVAVIHDAYAEALAEAGSD